MPKKSQKKEITQKPKNKKFKHLKKSNEDSQANADHPGNINDDKILAFKKTLREGRMPKRVISMTDSTRRTSKRLKGISELMVEENLEKIEDRSPKGKTNKLLTNPEKKKDCLKIGISKSKNKALRGKNRTIKAGTSKVEKDALFNGEEAKGMGSMGLPQINTTAPMEEVKKESFNSDSFYNVNLSGNKKFPSPLKDEDKSGECFRRSKRIKKSHSTSILVSSSKKLVNDGSTVINSIYGNHLSENCEDKSIDEGKIDTKVHNLKKVAGSTVETRTNDVKVSEIYAINSEIEPTHLGNVLGVENAGSAVDDQNISSKLKLSFEGPSEVRGNTAKDPTVYPDNKFDSEDMTSFQLPAIDIKKSETDSETHLGNEGMRSIYKPDACNEEKVYDSINSPNISYELKYNVEDNEKVSNSLYKSNIFKKDNLNNFPQSDSVNSSEEPSNDDNVEDNEKVSNSLYKSNIFKKDNLNNFPQSDSVNSSEEPSNDDNVEDNEKVSNSLYKSNTFKKDNLNNFPQSDSVNSSEEPSNDDNVEDNEKVSNSLYKSNTFKKDNLNNFPQSDSVNSSEEPSNDDNVEDNEKVSNSLYKSNIFKKDNLNNFPQSDSVNSSEEPSNDDNVENNEKVSNSLYKSNIFKKDNLNNFPQSDSVNSSEEPSNNNLSPKNSKGKIPGQSFIVAIKGATQEGKAMFNCVLCFDSSIEACQTGSVFNKHIRSRQHALCAMEVENYELYLKYKESDASDDQIRDTILTYEATQGIQIFTLAMLSDYETKREIVEKRINFLKERNSKFSDRVIESKIGVLDSSKSVNMVSDSSKGIDSASDRVQSFFSSSDSSSYRVVLKKENLDNCCESSLREGKSVIIKSCESLKESGSTLDKDCKKVLLKDRITARSKIPKEYHAAFSTNRGASINKNLLTLNKQARAQVNISNKVKKIIVKAETMNILFLGHSWINDLEQAFCRSSEFRYRAEFFAQSWGTIDMFTSRVKSVLKCHHTHVVLAALLTSAYTQEMVLDAPKSPMMTLPNLTFSTEDFGSCMSYFIDECRRISPGVQVMLLVPPPLDLHYYNLFIMRNHREEREIYLQTSRWSNFELNRVSQQQHNLMASLLPSIHWPGKNLLLTECLVKTQCGISSQRYDDFCQNKISSLGKHGYLRDGLHPTPQLARAILHHVPLQAGYGLASHLELTPAPTSLNFPPLGVEGVSISPKVEVTLRSEPEENMSAETSLEPANGEAIRVTSTMSCDKPGPSSLPMDDALTKKMSRKRVRNKSSKARKAKKKKAMLEKKSEESVEMLGWRKIVLNAWIKTKGLEMTFGCEYTPDERRSRFEECLKDLI